MSCTLNHQQTAGLVGMFALGVLLVVGWYSQPQTIGAEVSVPAVRVSPAAAPATIAPLTAEPSPGSLFICGGGILPPAVLERFIELAGGAAARIVYIPTASMYAGTPDLELRIAYWREQLATGKLRSFDVLHAADRNQANDATIVGPLKQATAVWFGGGVQSRLTERYLGTAVEREVNNVLRRGGTVGGTSAGAAIMSEVMIRGGMPNPDMGQGFGFVKHAVVDQHFIKRNRHQRLVNALHSNPQKIGLGIDEGTALIVSGDGLEVVGESHVVICVTGPDKTATFQELKPGEPASLESYVAKVRRAEPAIAAAKPVAVEKLAADNSKRDDMPQTGADPLSQRGSPRVSD